MGLCDCVAPRMDLMHKRETLNCRTTYLGVKRREHSSELRRASGRFKKRIPDARSWGCSLLHREDFKPKPINPPCLTVSHSP
jgi:hypothetical protein